MRFETLTLTEDATSKNGLAATVRGVLEDSVVVHVKNAAVFPDPLASWERLIGEIGDFAAVGEEASGQKAEQKSIWMDVRFDPRHNQSFRHFNSAQPLHTDGAYEEEYPGTAFFFCAKQAPTGGATLFLDVADLIDILQKEEPALYRDLTTIPVRFSKLGGAGKTCCVLDEDDQGPRVNWNYYRVAGDQGPEVARLREEFHAFLQNRFVDRNDLLALRLETGDAVFFKDTRVLHGRHAYEAHAAGDRLIWKCYFKRLAAATT
ncbi:MAG TPA: TauD/TfdA family dioxygenase [Chthoniobacterales bacterium]|jgi:alpha-ketoglutarate-dependent taurine dioxygenase|nr:TauD/TfdA family dioxygenase [Chthoniobacterales bacterium]